MFDKMELKDEILDDLQVAEKNWNKIIDKAKTMGYREGIMDGKEAVYQENFEKGYEDGFRNGKIIGIKQGISIGKQLFLNESDTEHKIVLQKTDKDICVLCQENALMDKPLSEVVQNQEVHFIKIIEVLPSDDLVETKLRNVPK